MRWLLCIILLLCARISEGQKIGIQRIGAAEGIRVDDVRSVLLDSRGILWVGTYGEGLLYLRQGVFVNPAGANHYTGAYILAICESGTGEIIVISERGEAIFNGRDWRKSEGQACFDRVTEGIVLDTLQAGVGTVYEARTDGLFTRGLLDTIARRIEDVTGYLNDTIQSLAFGADNALWIATRNNGLLKRSGRELTCSPFISDNRWTVDDIHGLQLLGIRMDSSLVEWSPENGTVSLGRVSFGVTNILPYDNQTLLVNDDEGRLLILDRDSLQSARELVRSIRVAHMVLDRFGTVWIVDESGNVSTVESLDGGARWRRTYAAVDPGDLVEIFPVADGGLLLVYAYSIGELKGRRYTELARTSDRITSAATDADEVIWCGAASGGIFFYNKVSGMKAFGGGAEQVTQRPIKFITRLNSGLLLADDIWMYRIGFDSDGHNGAGTKFIDLPPGVVESCFYDMGYVYFVRREEVCGIPVSTGLNEGGKPVLYLRDVILPGGSIVGSEYSDNVAAFMRQTGDIHFSYSQNNLVFSWESIASQAGDVSYAYRLNGDDVWHELNDQNQLQLASLGPGEYAFDIRACDARMNCTTLSSPFAFTIASPWWGKWWVWTLIAALLSALVLLGVRRRELIIKNRAARQVELAQARTRALELEQKARQLQMRPHFISNALNAIQSKVLNGKSAEASDELVSFSKMMRAMLNASRKERVALDDEIDLLRKYVDVVSLAKGISASFDIKVSEDVETFGIEVPSMIFQPLVENCIEHGGPKISMDISAEDKFFVFAIRDNGPGFMEGDIDKSSSVALKLVRDRLAAIGGSMKMANAEGGGAMVELTIPVDQIL